MFTWKATKMENTFIVFDVFFRFLAIGVLYAMYRAIKDGWYMFTHLDEYEYDDWDYDDEDEEEYKWYD
jgi:hypothetical protein